jgi:hypothetical protein
MAAYSEKICAVWVPDEQAVKAQRAAGALGSRVWKPSVDADVGTFGTACNCFGEIYRFHTKSPNQ